MFKYFLWSAAIALVLAIGWWIVFTKNPMEPGNIYHPYNVTPARFDLVDVESAPRKIRPLVKEGFNILFETQKYAKGYSGDRLDCNNCHFNGGNSLGGANNGISLMGVTRKYPKILPGNVKYTLAERINACFEKSMNGNAVPVDSHKMKAILAYLEWISHEVSPNSETPWLGMKALRSKHVPDAKNGKLVYGTYCSVCHGTDGQGQPRKANLSYPPLWGKDSFNDAAGMNRLPILSSFVYYNMPFGQAFLTVEEALDVAAFIITQPRPPKRSPHTPQDDE
jgi:thiosulfate dehydrogenase